MPRAPLAVPVLLLALASLPGPAGPPVDRAIDWDFLEGIDADDRALIEEYAETARRLDLLALEIGRRWPSPLLEIEVSTDLARLRWRLPGDRPGTWHHGLVCPADRERLARSEATMEGWSARRRWRPLRLRNVRLVTPPGWNGRGVLLTGQGEIVRLLAID